MNPAPNAKPRPFLNYRLPIGIALAFLLGFVSVYFFAKLYATGAPLRSFHLIAASLAVDFCGLAVLLALLPTREQFAYGFPWLSAWGQTALFGAAAFSGMAVAPAHAEPARTFVALAALFVAQAAMIAAFHAALTTLLYPREPVARLLLLLAMGGLMTTLFWTRGVIRGVEQTPPNGRHRAEVLADGIMKMSPPLAVCSIWYGECDAGIHGTAGRFDFVHSPMTYLEWIGGSGEQVPYPDILPPATRSNALESERESPGLAAALLLWSLPLLILLDILMRKRRPV